LISHEGGGKSFLLFACSAAVLSMIFSRIS
jgi:hypothetical protein